MKMIKIKDETYKELTIVMGTLLSDNGMRRSYDDVLKELIAFFKKKHK